MNMNETISQLKLTIHGKIDLIELTSRINQICDEAEDRQAVLSIILSDCVFDMSHEADSIRIQAINRWEQAVRRIERLPTIVIAQASGTISGPAVDLLLSTDYRIATSNFQFAIPTHQGQVWPGMLIHRLVHQIGMTNCRRLLFNINELNASYAFDIGLIDEISDNNKMIDMVAKRYCRMANKEFAVRRQLMREAQTTTFEDALGAHLAACDRELRRLRDWKPLDPKGCDQ